MDLSDFLNKRVEIEDTSHNVIRCVVESYDPYDERKINGKLVTGTSLELKDIEVISPYDYDGYTSIFETFILSIHEIKNNIVPKIKIKNGKKIVEEEIIEVQIVSKFMVNSIYSYAYEDMISLTKDGAVYLRHDPEKTRIYSQWGYKSQNETFSYYWANLLTEILKIDTDANENEESDFISVEIGVKLKSQVTFVIKRKNPFAKEFKRLYEIAKLYVPNGELYSDVFDKQCIFQSRNLTDNDINSLIDAPFNFIRYSEKKAKYPAGIIEIMAWDLVYSCNYIKDNINLDKVLKLFDGIKLPQSNVLKEELIINGLPYLYINLEKGHHLYINKEFYEGFKNKLLFNTNKTKLEVWDDFIKSKTYNL